VGGKFVLYVNYYSMAEIQILYDNMHLLHEQLFLKIAREDLNTIDPLLDKKECNDFTENDQYVVVRLELYVSEFGMSNSPHLIEQKEYSYKITTEINTPMDDKTFMSRLIEATSGYESKISTYVRNTKIQQLCWTQKVDSGNNQFFQAIAAQTCCITCEKYNDLRVFLRVHRQNAFKNHLFVCVKEKRGSNVLPKKVLFESSTTTSKNITDTMLIRFARLFLLRENEKTMLMQSKLKGSVDAIKFERIDKNVVKLTLRMTQCIEEDAILWFYMNNIQNSMENIGPVLRKGRIFFISGLILLILETLKTVD
jgi:hypothetical protein